MFASGYFYMKEATQSLYHQMDTLSIYICHTD